MWVRPEREIDRTKASYAFRILLHRFTSKLARGIRMNRNLKIFLSPSGKHWPPVKQGRAFGRWIRCHKVFSFVDLQVRVRGVNGLIAIAHRMLARRFFVMTSCQGLAWKMGGSSVSFGHSCYPTGPEFISLDDAL